MSRGVDHVDRPAVRESVDLGQELRVPGRRPGRLTAGQIPGPHRRGVAGIRLDDLEPFGLEIAAASRCWTLLEQSGPHMGTTSKPRALKVRDVVELRDQGLAGLAMPAPAR